MGKALPYTGVSYVQRWVDEGRAKGRAEERVSARVEALLAVLDARNLVPGNRMRYQIEECTDEGTLLVWLGAAATAKTVEEVFRGGPREVLPGVPGPGEALDDSRPESVGRPSDVPEAPPLREALIQLFRNCPAMAAELLQEQDGIALPPFTAAQVADVDLPGAGPALVVAFRSEDRMAFALVVEVQMVVDPQKKLSWPCALSAARMQLECPVMLLVVTPDDLVEDWAAEPIELGLGSDRITPVVLGPLAIPAAVDGTAVGRPELAVLSAVAHRFDPAAFELAWTAIRAAASLGEEIAESYTAVVMSVLAEPDRALMRERMRRTLAYSGGDDVQRWVDEGRETGVEEGRLDAQRDAILAILAARGIERGDAAWDRVFACTHEPTLDAWLRAAATAERLEDVFGEP